MMSRSVIGDDKDKIIRKGDPQMFQVKTKLTSCFVVINLIKTLAAERIG
jgi:hypothetical protein